MFCASKRSMPNDETEDLAILRMTIKRLECLENERKTPDKNGRKLDLSQLQNQILANVKTVEKHFKHYLEANGYNETVLKPLNSESITSLCDGQEVPVNVSLFEVIKKFECDVKRLEDDCQEYRLRIESLQESEERHKEIIDELRKDLQTSEIRQYELQDQIGILEQTVNHLENEFSLKSEEIVTISEENTAVEERLNTRIFELEGDIHAHKVALIKVNTKYTLAEADRLKMEGEYAEKCREVRKLQFLISDLQEKLKVLQEAEHNKGVSTDINLPGSPRNCPVRNKYDEILSCMSTLFIDQWIKTTQSLRTCGKREDYIAFVLGKILQITFEECENFLNENMYKKGPKLAKTTFESIEESAQKVSSGPPLLMNLTLKTIEDHPKLILSDLFKNVDKSLSIEFNDKNDSSILEKFTERSINTIWRLLVKCNDVRFNWNHHPVHKTDDSSDLLSSDDIITVLPHVFVINSQHGLS